VSAIVFNSYLSRDQHVAFGIDSTKCVVIPNGFDTTVWCPDKNERATVRQTLGIPCNARVVGHVGRYHPLKDQATLLGAMQTVMLRHPNVYLLLIGRDVSPDNSNLKEYFDRLPMDRVYVTGERLDVPCLVRAMDVLCLSSRSEAFPNVLGEAMACGVVCVTTDAGDARVIVGETGLVVPIGDHNALARALSEVIGKDESELKSLGSRARDRITQHYSITEAASTYQNLLSANNLTPLKSWSNRNDTV